MRGRKSGPAASKAPFSLKSRPTPRLCRPTSAPAPYNRGRGPARKTTAPLLSASLCYAPRALLPSAGGQAGFSSSSACSSWVWAGICCKKTCSGGPQRETTGVVESLVNHGYQSPARAGTTSSTAPTIRYHDAAGHAYSFTVSAAATRPASYSVGEPVTVYYDPARPCDAQLHGFLAQWMGPAIALGIGLVFSLLGWVCIAALGKART